MVLIIMFGLIIEIYGIIWVIFRENARIFIGFDPVYPRKTEIYMKGD
jgi:hypothetical protein